MLTFISWSNAPFKLKSPLYLIFSLLSENFIHVYNRFFVLFLLFPTTCLQHAPDSIKLCLPSDLIASKIVIVINGPLSPISIDQPTSSHIPKATCLSLHMSHGLPIILQLIVHLKIISSQQEGSHAWCWKPSYQRKQMSFICSRYNHIQRRIRRLSMVAHAFNLSTKEAEGGELLQVWCQLGLHSKLNGSPGYPVRPTMKEPTRQGERKRVK